MSIMAGKRQIPETLFDNLGFRMTYEAKRVIYEAHTEHQHLVLARGAERAEADNVKIAADRPDEERRDGGDCADGKRRGNPLDPSFSLGLFSIGLDPHNLNLRFQLTQFRRQTDSLGASLIAHLQS